MDDGGAERHHLVVAHEHGAEPEAVTVEEGRQDVRRRLPQLLRRADESEQQPERDDDGHIDGRAVQRSHQHCLDEEPEGGRDHEEHEHQRHDRVDVPALPQLPEHEGRDHADRTVGEVEDARGRVGDDQPGCDQRIDAARDQTDDSEGQPLGHGITR